MGDTSRFRDVERALKGGTSMALLFLGQPFALVVAYGALGAFFMPFLAGTLIPKVRLSRANEGGGRP